MKTKAREALDRYYEEAASWSKDRQNALRTSRSVAWIVAAVAALIALVEAFALFALTPLKTVEPYTLLVDKQTGYVQALKPLDPQLVAGDKALTQSFLVQYVIAREGFDINSVQANYRKVALFSEGTARAAYISGMQPTSPDSPFNRYPRSTVVETHVKSISPMARNTALVRFDTVRHDAGGQEQPPQNWVTVIKYRYSNQPLSTEDRFLNPLGFEVSSYQRSAEALTPVVVVPEPRPSAPESTVASPTGSNVPQRTSAAPTPQPRAGGAQQGIELTL